MITGPSIQEFIGLGRYSPAVVPCIVRILFCTLFLFPVYTYALRSYT